jgi:hypothetical protein
MYSYVDNQEIRMSFELATVISCSPSGCWVAPVDEGSAFETRYSKLVQDRVKIRPGQLVAVDMEPAIPEVAWRWYRVQVVESGEGQVIVQERERQLSAARVPGLETPGQPGDETWVTGMESGWELHDRVLDGKPSDPARLRKEVLPRITVLLSAGQ